MGILSNSCAITRYLARPNAADPVEALQTFAFREVADALEINAGFVGLGDAGDTSFRTPPMVGRFLRFSLRIDIRRVPGSLLKVELAEKVRAEKRDTGRQFITKERKRELKEQVRLRLLAQALPVPALFDCAWDLVSGEVWFTGTSDRACASFLKLFERAFGVSPAFYMPAGLDHDSLDGLLTRVFDDPLDGLEVIGRATFAGNQEGVTVTAGAPSATEESKAARAAGKGVASLTLCLDDPFPGCCTVTLKAGDVSTLYGLRVPKVEKVRDGERLEEDAVFLEKMKLLGEACAAVDALMREYAGQDDEEKEEVASDGATRFDDILASGATPDEKLAMVRERMGMGHIPMEVFAEDLKTSLDFAKTASRLGVAPSDLKGVIANARGAGLFADPLRSLKGPGTDKIERINPDGSRTTLYEREKMVEKLAGDPGVRAAHDRLMDSFARSGADRVTVQVEGEEPVTLYERTKEEA